MATPLKVYRISRRSEFDGEGGMYSNGRWHTKGRPVLYAASHRSLALFEMSLLKSHVLEGLYIMEISLDPAGIVNSIDHLELPDGWNEGVWKRSTQEIGTAFLEENLGVCLKIPSACPVQESNYILNPLHENFDVYVNLLSITDLKEHVLLGRTDE